MTRSAVFLILAFSGFLAVCAMFFLSRPGDRRSFRMEGRRAIVRRLHLTDFALWTEARYARHPSQADFFSPFQDTPSGLDHFPAGAVIAPPALGRNSR